MTQRQPVQQPAAGVAPPACWQLRLLGGFELQHPAAEGPLRLPGRAAMALLARLALWPQREHPREVLVELLWPGVAPGVARNRLRQALSTVKSALESAGGGPALQADRLAVRLRPGVIACDVQQFERALREGDAVAARALYRGELLPGFYAEWIGDERARLAALYEQLDARPPPQPAAPSAPATRAAPVALRLPHYLTPAFGVADPAARLGRLLAAGARLLTLHGPGGSGKTRLAVEFARGLGATAPFDTVAFVPLACCANALQMVAAVAAALDAPASVLAAPAGAGAAPAAVAALLEGRRVLLVLDNFEQLPEAAASVVAGWSSALPTLVLLVTSRRPLGLPGEQLLPLAPLPLPAPQADLAALARNPAVALLVDRAQAVRSGFRLRLQDRAAVITLVHRLEGMPLAIELAAPRLRSLSPAELAALLAPPPLQTAGQAPRLALLARTGAGGSGMAAAEGGPAARHASMQAVIDWSWRQLSPMQQRLAGALAVFHGGATLAALGEVEGSGAAAVAVPLDELHAHSLVHTRPACADGHPRDEGPLRFQLYEPVREFVAARLDAAALRGWHARHRAWLRGWVEALPPTPALPALRAELPNLDAALTSAVADGVPGEAVQLLLPLRRVLEDVALPAHALAQAEAAVAACADPLLRARGLSLLGPLRSVAGSGSC